MTRVTVEQVTAAQAQDVPAAGGDVAETLEALALEAGEIDTAGPPGAAAAQAAAEAQASAANVHAIVAALKGARSMAAPKFAWWQDYRTVWSDDQLQAIAGALEAIRDHMGWDVAELMKTFGPWLALLLAVGVPAWATYEAIQARREELQRLNRMQHRPPAQNPS